ncbi:unnamed protein product [Strongylus vulgaris]|uniref:Tyrosinase copper-binding domain-containing protein n=2 Tax=Strongylus vulgaris TaxID=40348 RepID=A0A3P7I1A5_STRVU|nr:unnamed protein product [Strongylus vulgaris]
MAKRQHEIIVDKLQTLYLNSGRYSNNRCILPNGQVYGKAIRKELRMMTDNERSRFRSAMWGIRQTTYRELGVIHSSYSTSPGAHGGPAFLPWHREFIKRLT